MSQLRQFLPRYSALRLWVLALVQLLVFGSATAQNANFAANQTSGCSPLTVRFSNLSTGQYDVVFWDLGNGNTSTLTNPVSTYITPGSYSISLTVTDTTSGVSSTFSLPDYITVFEDPNADFSVDTTAGCAPFSVNFTDLSTSPDGTIRSWSWDFGDGTISSFQYPSHTYGASGTYDITLVVEDDNGCQATVIERDLISVSEPPAVDFTVDAPNGCTAPHTVSFASTINPAGTYTYAWDFGDGTTSTAANPTNTFLNTGTYSVSLEISDVNGCTASETKADLIFVNQPVADFTVLNPTACTGTAVSFLNGSVGATNYIWNFGDGNTSTADNPSHTYSVPGTYTVTLQAINSAGCFDVNVQVGVVVVNVSPAASFLADDPIACEAPMIVNFTDNSGGAIVAWEWDLGNGQTSPSQNPTGIYTAAGTYTVSLTVTDANGCQSTVSLPNYINLLEPEAAFLTSADDGCAPLTVNFFDISTSGADPITDWFWNFGDGNFSTQQNPTHTFTTPGQYPVSLTITTANGCQDQVILQFIEVGTAPVVDFDATPQAVCIGENVNFNDLTTGTGTAWFWDFGDGTGANIPDPIHAYQDTGFYDVTLIVEYFGCFDTLIQNDFIRVNGPTAEFLAQPVQGCGPPVDIDFFDLSTNANTWNWNFGDGDTSQVRNPVHVYTTTGNFIVSLVVTDSVSGCADQFELEVPITDPVAGFTADVTYGCAAMTVNFTNASLDANAFVWYFGDGNTSTAANPTHQYQNPGSYTVRLVASDGVCTDTLTRTNYIRAVGPEPDFAADVFTGCAPLPISFRDSSVADSGTTITNWLWQFGDGGVSTLQNPTYTYSDPGLYDVTLIILDSEGCQRTITKSNYINPTFPSANFTSNDTISCPGAFISFTNLSSGNGLSYIWNFGDGTTSTSVNPTKVYPANAAYTVSLQVTDINGCVDTRIRNGFINVGQPTAAFTADNTTATCPPLTVNFEDQSSANVIAWEWDFGDGSTSSLANPSKIYATAGTYDVTLIVTTVQGCKDTLVQSGFIDIEGPTGAFTFSPLTGCQPLEVNFSVTSPNPLWTYEIFYGDGASALGPNTTHTYTQDTTATPVMVVEDEFGCRVAVTSMDSIEVLPLPNVSFAADQSKICLGQVISFTNTSTSESSITGFSWDFGDGNTSTLVNPIHTYLDTGEYVVNLTVTTSDGCVDTADSPVIIEVTGPPTAAFVVDTDEDCVPLPVTFTDGSSGDFPLISWDWDFGDGTTQAGQAIPAHLYDSAAVYSATLTVTDNQGCTGSATRTITVHPLPPVDFSAFRYGCAPIAVAFTDETIGTSPAVSWLWDFGDGTTSTDQDPSHVYTADGNYTVSLTVTDANGCVNTLTRIDYIQLEHPAANFISNAGVTCPPQTVTFQDLSIADTTITWSWDFGDGSPASTAQNPSHTYYGSDTFDVTLIVTNLFGCRDTFTRPEHVITYPRPTASFTSSDTSICLPANVSFASTSTPSGAPLVSYLWNFGTGAGTTTPTASFLYVNDGTYTVSLEITDDNGCRDTAYQQVYVHPNPDVNFQAGDTVGCAITSISFQDLTTGTNAPVSWRWEFGDGNIGTTQNPSNVYLNDGSYDIKLVATDINGCVDSLTKTNYIVLDHPDADFNVNQTILCPGTIASFSDVSTGPFAMVSWIWDFGDGSPLDYSQNPTHAYTTPGTYNVTLIVTDGITCRDTITKSTFISVYTPPTAGFTYTPTTGCDPLTVQFTETSTDGTGMIVNYAWDFGDGGSSVLPSPTYVYSVPGTYTVSLTVTDDNGCTDVITNDVTVFEVPTVDFIANQRVGCSPISITFSDLTTSPYVITAWSWDFGDGGTSTSPNPVHLYAADGTYTVKLVVTDQNGCQDSLTKTNYIRLTHPTANFTYNNSLVCPNEPIGVTFTDTSIPDTTIISWAWDFGDGGTSTLQNPSHSYSAAGTYTVSLTVTNILGCTSTSTQTNVISVRVPPAPDFAMSDSANCTPLTINFTDLTVAGDGAVVGWNWQFGNGDSALAQNPTYTWTTPGTYTVDLRVTDANGCVASTSTTVLARELPVADFFSPDTVGCAPRTVRFTNTSTSSATMTYWKWYFGDGDSAVMVSNPVHSYAADGIYDVTLIVGDQFGCQDTITRSNYIRLSHPVAAFTKDLSLVCPGIPIGVTFTDTSIPDTTITNWTWSFGDGATSALQNPSHSYAAPGIYPIQLIVTNILGCSDTLNSADNITVLDPPVTSFAVSDSADCVPHAVTFTETSTPGDAAIVSWIWDFGTGDSSIVQNPVYAYSTPGVYTVTLTAYDANGCYTSVSSPITAYENPVADFTASDSVGCGPATILFTDLSTGPVAMTSWLWEFGDGNTSTLTNPTHTYATDGSYTVTLTIVDANGCTHTYTKPEYIQLSHPIADFTVSATEICPGTSVSFTDQSVPDHPLVAWAWDFGDGGTSTLQNPSYVYHTPGSYSVTLTVTNALGCTDVFTFPTNITVHTPPTAATMPGDTAACTPFLVNFQDNSTPGSFALSGWTWDFGNGNTSTIANPTAQTYATPGTYTVNLIAGDVFGCKDTATTTVTVNDLPTVDFFANQTNGCPPQVIRFTDISSGTAIPVAWSWDFGDGTTSNIRSPQHTYAGNGMYDVTLTVTDANGCVNTLTRSNYIRMRNPVADFNLSATVICPGASIDFSDQTLTDTTLLTWSWDFGDGGTSTVQNPTHVYTAAGTYTVSLIVTNVLGCTDTVIQPNVVTVNTRPDASYTTVADAGCAPFFAQFANTTTINSQPVVAWSWDFGNGTTSSLIQRNVSFQNPGSYPVSLIATDALGCTDTATGTITVYQNPQANFVASDSAGCSPTNITFFDQTLSSAPLNTWSWDFGNGDVSASPVPVTTYAVDGSYTVSLIVGDVNGCRDTLTKPQYINLSHPVAEFDVSQDEICPETEIQFFDMSIPDTTLMSWAWDFGDGTTSSLQNPVKTYSNPGVYTVTLTVTNILNCSHTIVKAGYIRVLTPPTALFAASDTIGCNPFSATFGDLSVGNPDPIISWRWEFGNGDTSLVQNPSVLFKNAGVYTVSLRVTDNKGCSNEETLTLTSIAPPVANFFSTDTVGCKEATSFFDLSTSSATLTAWKWYFGDGDSAMVQNPTHTYPSTGLYTVTLAVEDQYGCTDTLTKVDYIDLTRPIAAFVQDNDEVCPGSAVQFLDASIPDFPIVNWAWDFGDGSTGTGAKATHIYSTPGTYSVSLTITNSKGCQDTEIGLITVLPPPIASFNASTTAGCDPLTVNFSNSSIGFSAALINYQWSFGDGNFSNDIAPDHTYTIPGTYSVILQVMDGNGCVDDTTLEVRVYPLPVPDFVASTTVGCAPQQILFTQLASGINPIVSYLWDFGDGNTSTLPNPAHVYSQDGLYTVTLTVTDVFGCVQTSTKTDYIRLRHPQADFMWDPSTGCPGTEVSFADISLPDTTLATWSWSFGDGGTSSLSNPTYVYRAAGIYDVELVITNLLGCSDTIRKDDIIEIFTPPVTAFTPTDSTDCTPFSLQFFNESVQTDAPLVAYQWDFGDGNGSSLANPGHTFTAHGTYGVQLITTDANGCKDTMTNEITALQLPQVGFNASDSFGCSPVSISFFDQSFASSPIIGWNWTFGDGGISTAQFPVHTYTADGTYDVGLEITDLNGCVNSLVKPQYIKLAHPRADFTRSSSQVCTGTVVSFTDLSVPDTTIQSWAWDFGDGNGSTQQNPTHIYSTSGVYDVTLTITNIFGCSHTINKSGFVDVLPGPTPQFVPSLPAGCTPFEVSFQDQSVGTTSPIVAWSWDFGDGNVSSAQNPMHRYTTPGMYTVALTITDNQGCVNSFTRQVESLELPTAAFFSNDTLGCAPHTAAFVDISTGSVPIIGWEWDFGDGNTSNQQFPVHNYLSDGDFTVSLVATDQNGCVDTVTRVEYIRLSNPQPDFTISDPLGCPGVAVTFTDQSIGDTTIVSWAWDFGDGTTSIVQSPTKVYTTPGMYTVSLRVTNVNGCSKTHTVNNAVTVTTAPVADFILADTMSCTPFALTINDNTTTVSAPIVSWFWDFGDGGTSTDQEPLHTYTTPGSYRITFRVEDANGCVDSTARQAHATIPPVPNFTVDDSLGCAPFTARFSDRTQMTHQVTSWLWDFGDGTSSTDPNPVHTYQQDGVYTVTLTVSDDNGCVEVIQKPELIRLWHPAADFDSDLLTGCAGSSIAFNDLSTGDTTLTGWFWDFGNGDQSVTQNPVYTYNGSGQFDVTLIVTNVLGCRDTIRRPRMIDIFQKPIARFSTSDTGNCFPYQANFTDLSTSIYGMNSWQWFVNGQLKSISQNFSFFFDTVGVYNVKLLVTDANGCQDSVFQRVERFAIPVADFLASDTLGCSPEGITFFDRSAPTPAAWQWDFGDGNTSNQQNPVNVYQADGIYTVSLRITDVNGCVNEMTKVNYIELDHPQIDFSVEYEAGCPPLPVTFRATGSGLAGFANWQWDFGDGRVTTVLRDSIIYAYPVAGVYDVSLTVTDSLGCKSTITKPEIVSVLGDIIPDPIELHAVTVLNDDQVGLSWRPHNDDDFMKYTIYREDPGAGFVRVFESFYISDTTWIDDQVQTTQNSYCYKVTVTNFCGTESDLNITGNHCTIEVTATPTPGQILVDWNPYIGWRNVAQYEVYRVNSYNPQDVTFLSVLPGTQTQFSEEIEDCFNDYFYRVKAIGTAQLQESWSDTSLAVNFHGTVGRATQLVRATVENNREVLIEWKQFELPGIEFVYLEKQYNNGPWAVLATLSQDQLQYVDTDVDVQKNAYRYRVSAQDSCGNYTPLSNIGRTVVTKVEKDGLTPIIRWTPYEEWTYGVDRYAIEIFVDTLGQWQIVDRVNGDIHEYYDTQSNFDQPEYCYRVVAEEQGGNRALSYSNESCISILSNIRVPNAFTPNLDGINDEWKASGLHIQTFHLQIFSRWGMMLFESYDPEIGWDGTYRGQQVKEGVYTYVIRGTSYNGAPFLQKGTITLMR